MLCGCCKAASKDGSGAEDAGKYQLNAVRFYEVEDVIGVTAPTDIAETAKNFTIDHFDTYTDPAGKVYALILGSDYDSLNGLEVYDTIDLTNLPVRVDNEEGDPTEHLAILAQTPEAYMKLGAGTFPTTAVDAYVAADLYELTAGLNLPVQVTVQNTGTTAVNDVTVRMGGAEKRFTGLDLLPGQRATLTVDYLVPETVQDVPYSVSANNAIPAIRQAESWSSIGPTWASPG